MTFFYDGDELIGFSVLGNNYYYGKDSFGVIRYIYNQNGSLYCTYAYDAWGNLIDRAFTDPTNTIAGYINPIRYKSYYYDSETGFYYLQSRYYDPVVGRFLNADDAAYLGASGAVLGWTLYGYCENNALTQNDFNGYAPSLSVLTQMHNAVQKSIVSFLWSLGIISLTEVRVCDNHGHYNGRMDVYSYFRNIMYEVKRNNYAGIRGGKRQLKQYADSYVYSLYHLLIPIKIRPIYSNLSVKGITKVSNYCVYYCSRYFPDTKYSLVLYDYFSLEELAEKVFEAVRNKVAEYEAVLKQFSNSVAREAMRVYNKIKNLVETIGESAIQVIELILESLIQILPIVILAIIVLLALVAMAPVLV